MLSYIQLKSFVVLCDTGSFSKAALKMETNQSTITKRVQQIESYLDKTLLHRQTNGKEVLLTYYGELFLLYAEKVIGSYALLDKSFCVDNEEKERLNIGSVNGFFHVVLNEKIKLLAAAYPKLDINISINGADKLFSGLESREIDIIFTLGHHLAAEIETKFIRYLNMGWYVSQDLYQKMSKLDSTSEIYAKFPVLLCKENSLAIEIVKRAFKNNHIKNYTIQASDSTQTMIGLINNGFGIGFLPKYYVDWDNQRRTDKLIELDLLLIEGFSIYSAIYKNSNKKQYYDFIMDAIDKERIFNSLSSKDA